MLHFCTLFNGHYLSRGIALYQSLEKYCPSFHIYIYAFDDLSFNILTALNLQHATIVSLDEFEDEALLKVKPFRSVGEYCWTCTPSVIKYSIDNFGIDSCTYLDADLYFFSDPSVLIEEVGDQSILITEHRYTPEYDQSGTSGIYCVQFMTFKNNPDGMTALKWWRDACIDWCYARFEDGKFGDQKYLDDWPNRFNGVHVLEHRGGGVAPWNVQQYKLEELKNETIFYHFHGLRFLDNDKVDLGSYKLSKDSLLTIYKPYLVHLKKIEVELELAFDSYSQDIAASKSDAGWRSAIRKLRRRVKKVFNVFDKDEILCLN